VTLNTFNNLKATDFAVSIPNATANFLFNDSDSKVDSKSPDSCFRRAEGLTKDRDRVPIATGSIGNR